MFDDFYGLEGRPFQLTPDPAFYFESATHRKALSYLGYGLAQGEGFVVITGEVGAGKSTLVAYLMATIDPNRLTAAQVVTSVLDGGEIVHVVARAFGLDIAGRDKASALAAIERFLHEEARAGRRCLLIVDEAQNLPIAALEELRMLSNFQLGSYPLLQTLLLGQPEFRQTLLESEALEQLRQRVIATHHLKAMEAKEVQPYIEHRMACVGWKGNPSFDQRVFAEIYHATGGIPRRINQIVNRLLLLGAVDQRTRIDSAMLGQVLDELREDGSIAPQSAPPAASQSVPPAASQSAPGVEASTEAGAAPADRPAPSGLPDALPVAEAAEDAPAAPLGDTFDARAVTAEIEAALAERDQQIDELQQAILELAAAAERREQEAALKDDGALAALHLQTAEIGDRVARMEARLGEQERTLRHALTMLIEWIETGDGQREAA